MVSEDEKRVKEDSQRRNFGTAEGEGQKYLEAIRDEILAWRASVWALSNGFPRGLGISDRRLYAEEC